MYPATTIVEGVWVLLSGKRDRNVHVRGGNRELRYVMPRPITSKTPPLLSPWCKIPLLLLLLLLEQLLLLLLLLLLEQLLLLLLLLLLLTLLPAPSLVPTSAPHAKVCLHVIEFGGS